MGNAVAYFEWGVLFVSRAAELLGEAAVLISCVRSQRVVRKYRDPKRVVGNVEIEPCCRQKTL